MMAIITMTVTIPACRHHEGLYARTVKILDSCPICGKRRGDVVSGLSYDGSRRLAVDMWQNPCGHLDRYSDVRDEARNNGLNSHE